MLCGPLACKKDARPAAERSPAPCIPTADEEISPEAARRLLERLAVVGRQQRFAITLPAEELSSYLRQSTRGSAIQRLGLELGAGEVCLSAEILARRTHRVILRFAPRAAAGKLQMHLQAASYDGRAIPRIVLAALEAALNAALADASLGIVVEQVTVGAGCIQLVCSRQ